MLNLRKDGSKPGNPNEKFRLIYGEQFCIKWVKERLGSAFFLRTHVLGLGVTHPLLKLETPISQWGTAERGNANDG